MGLWSPFVKYGGCGYHRWWDCGILLSSMVGMDTTAMGIWSPFVKYGRCGYHRCGIVESFWQVTYAKTRRGEWREATGVWNTKVWGLGMR